MKYLTFLASPVLIFTLLACGHGRPVDESEITGTTQPIIPANTTMQPQTIPVNLNSQTTPATITPSGSTVAGMNPPHGQPGHRCDIAVGAPLNSKPAQQPATNLTSPVSIPTNQPVQPAATTAVAPGMNPAHGQPGHRCDIAVGAPLNSKPAQLPATNSTTPVTTSVAPGMNPPHGQPGHRCDIAVGAPLNSKPAQQPATAVTTPVTNQPVQQVAPGMNPPHGQPGHRCDIAVGAPLNSKPTLVTGTPSTNTVTSSQSIPSIVPIKLLPDSAKQNR